MTTVPGEEKRQQFWLDNRRFVGSVFLLPTVLYIVLMVGMPFVVAILFSVTDVIAGDTSMDWVGLRNFETVWNTASFQQALRDSFMFTLSTQILVIIFANILAIVLTQDFRGKWFIRFLVILPWATPVALSTIGWLWFLDSRFSPIDWLLREVNLLGPGTAFGPANNMTWLGRTTLAQASVIFVQAWRLTPLAAVILMAALTSIPKDITDQALVDGSRFFRTLFQVKLPLVLPIMLIALLFSTVFSFGDMAVVYILTRGGPIDNTHVLPTWSYQVGIVGANLGEGAAVALFIFPVLLAASIVLLRVASRTEIN